MKSQRYLIDFDSKKISKEYHDVIIIGSGIAGIYTALEIDQKYDVAVLTKETMDMSNSVLAQGGIAVSLDKEDSPELHLRDTLYAGAGLCDEDTVRVLVNEAATNIECLCRYGVNFDKKGHALALTREGAHSKNRIIHAGDTTGKEVCDKLISEVRDRTNIVIKERTFALDLITEGNSSKGILTYDEDTGEYKLYLSNIVVLATGGFGQIYKNTTNPEVATGDGVCLAYRAGAELMDLEFIQFHPTVLFHPENKSFLISEAVRGEGAMLKNLNGERFMANYHELEELAPRDVVSRAIFAEMKKTESDHVWLDITFKGREYLENRFPNIFKTCLDYGIDISKDYIPVAPAEHYCMGGIKTDVNGRTNIIGLFACGETACNGIHGANRLASNSLLEGLVFGNKIASEINNSLKRFEGKCEFTEISYKGQWVNKDIDTEVMRALINKTMTKYVGILRDREGLETALKILNDYLCEIADKRNKTLKDFELQNIALLSGLVIQSCIEREESRGAHYRSDYSKTEDGWKRHIIRAIES